MARFRKAKKGPFDDLDNDFKTNVENYSEEEIRKKICEVAMNEVDNQKSKADDQDLKNKKEEAKVAGQQYSDATKANRLRIGYCKAILEARGKA